MSTIETSSVRWGGILETLEYCTETESVPEKIKFLKTKLAQLEASKNIKEIQHSLHFTIEERNYLNSPLLDEIFDTIFSINPHLEACKKGKLDALKFYMKRQEFKNKNNGLLKAVWNVQKNIVEFLLQDNTIKQTTKNAALVDAARLNKELLELLLIKGADVNAEGHGALCGAAFHGNMDTVKLLLKYGANPSAGITHAYNGGHDEIFKLLINLANLEYDKEDAFLTACREGYIGIAKYLVEEEKIYINDGIKNAIRGHHIETLEFLLQSPAYDHRADFYLVPWCATNNYHVALELLLKYGADPHVDDDSALKNAAWCGYKNIVELLLKDVSQENLNDALDQATEKNRTDIVEFLLVKGAKYRDLET